MQILKVFLLLVSLTSLSHKTLQQYLYFPMIVRKKTLTVFKTEIVLQKNVIHYINQRRKCSL